MFSALSKTYTVYSSQKSLYASAIASAKPITLCTDSPGSITKFLVPLPNTMCFIFRTS